MLSRAASDCRRTSTMSANCLPFKSCFIHGNQTSRKERGRANGWVGVGVGVGDTIAILFLAKMKALCILFDGENTSFDASLVIYIVLIFLQL